MKGHQHYFGTTRGRLYRVASDTPRGTLHEYADDLESAQSIVETIGGRIECYVYGWGWVRWCEAMKGRLPE